MMFYCIHNINTSLDCSDIETTYANCSDGDVRLTGGSSNWGRLEVWRCVLATWGVSLGRETLFFSQNAVFAEIISQTRSEHLCA